MKIRPVKRPVEMQGNTFRGMKDCGSSGFGRFTPRAKIFPDPRKTLRCGGTPLHAEIPEAVVYMQRGKTPQCFGCKSQNLIQMPVGKSAVHGNIDLAEIPRKKGFGVRRGKKRAVCGKPHRQIPLRGIAYQIRKFRVKQSLPHHMEVGDSGKRGRFGRETLKQSALHETRFPDCPGTERTVSVADVRELQIGGAERLAAIHHFFSLRHSSIRVFPSPNSRSNPSKSSFWIMRFISVQRSS